MTNHFTPLGLPVSDDKSAGQVIEAAYQAGTHEQVDPSTTVVSWRDPSGGGLDLLLTAPGNGGTDLACASPQFVGGSRQSVRVNAIRPADGCAGCALVEVEVLDGAGEGLYPLAVAPARIAASADRLAKMAERGTPVPASIVFVAEEIETYPDEAAFAAGQERGGDAPGFATESLIPVGLFPDREHPSAAALVHGVVTEARRLTNAWFGAEFWHLTVRTFGGLVDVVADPDGTGEIEPGAIVAVDGWACGQLGEPS